MDPPRLSLVPSSRDVDDNAPAAEGAEERALGRDGGQRRSAALCRSSREAAHSRGAVVCRGRAARRGEAQAPPAEDEDIASLLEELRAFYAGRGVNLVRVAGKWAFRTAEDLAYLLERYAVQERRLSKAALETLAIIAYHQPVTRAEIEEIRGVTTSVGTLDILLETGWVRLRGRRRAPGRPVTYGTTDAFLSHFGLESIKDLPGLSELQGLGPARRQPAARFQRARAERRCRADARRAAARGGRGRGRGRAAARSGRGRGRRRRSRITTRTRRSRPCPTARSPISPEAGALDLAYEVPAQFEAMVFQDNDA